MNKLKIISIILFLVLQNPAKAQLDKGQWLLNAQFGGNRNNYENSYPNLQPYYSSVQATFKPAGNINYFIMRNTSVGLGGAYLFDKNENAYFNTTNSDKTQIKTKAATLNLLFNQYFKVTSRFILYAGITGGYQKGYKYSWTFSNDNEKSYMKQLISRMSAGIQFGLMYTFRKRIAVNLNVSGFEYYKMRTETENKLNRSDQTEWSTQLSKCMLSVGVSYFLKKSE